MKPLPTTPAMLTVARRVVWFKEPSETLADPVHFLTHVMTYGTVEDLRTLQGVVGPNEYRKALEQAPPGVFDPRSWAYWNLKCAITPAPPLPVRHMMQPLRPWLWARLPERRKLAVAHARMVAGKTLIQVRVFVDINLIIGLLTIAIATLGSMHYKLK